MPYIKQSLRDKVDPYIEDLVANIASRPGHVGVLNYVCTRILLGVCRRRYTEINYEQLVMLNGILETMKSEINNRLTDPYEFHKQWTNGDVVEFALYSAETSPLLQIAEGVAKDN